MRSRCTGLVIIALFLASPVRAQAPAGKDAKADAGKEPAKDMKAAETKAPAKDMKSDATKSPAPAATPSPEKVKLPPGAILVVTDKLKEAVEQFPQMYLVSPEKFKELNDRIRALETQLKPEKATPHSCRLTGRLEGDYVALKAEFTFSTQAPKVAVVLGLQGAHLVEHADLDRELANVDYGDEGFVIRVEKEGPHQLTLNLKVPVGAKRAGGASGAPERGFDLGLPGAAATTLSLELPAAIKEIRVNDSVQKNKTGGRWEVPLRVSKQVSVGWKEPLALSGGNPLLSVDAQIVVKLDEGGIQTQAEVTLQDMRGQAKEWRLLLPPGAAATVKSLPAGTFQMIEPDPKNPWHTLQLLEPTTEPIVVTVQASAARPTSRFAIGPFAAVGAFRQQGTVLVQAVGDALRGQRLVYHRQGEVGQRDLPKNVAGSENLAYFQYALPPGAGKLPLELEFQTRTGLAETQTEQVVRLKNDGDSWYVETTTKIQARSLAEATDFLDVQLPRVRLDLEAIAVDAAAAYPAALAWASLAPRESRRFWAIPLEPRWEEEGARLALADGTPIVRLKWPRQSGKQVALTLHGKYAVPAGARHVRLDLPKPLGVLDGGATTTVSAGPLVEFITGTPGAEEAVPERQQWQRITESAPGSLDLAWRPYQPALPANAVADVTLHERSAQVREHLDFSLPANKGPAPAGSIRLRVSSNVKRLTVKEGGKLLGEPGGENGLLWVGVDPRPTGKGELVLEYDVIFPEAVRPRGPAGAASEIPLVWPEAATRLDAKVHVWSAAGTFPALAENAGDWHERGVESVPSHDSYPALVVQGAGLTVPLVRRPLPVDRNALVALFCDRTLLQVHIDDEGNQSYRVRYLIRKLGARQLTLELPTAVRGKNDKEGGLIAVRFGPDKQEKAVSWNDPAWNLATINLPTEMPPAGQPVFLELEYRLPATFAEGRRFGQTLLYPPRWQGEVLPGTVRWQVDLPGDQVAVVLGSGATLDYRWTLHGWLLAPEASVTAADLESWLTGRETAEGPAVGLAYSRPALGVQRLIALPRQWWLLVCSGLVLALGLGLYLPPMSRGLLWLLAATLCLAVVAAALLWPSMVPALLYGCEPGLAVLALLLGLQWLLQERYRRQVVFMPGFTRLPTGSSLTKSGRPPRPREPSTLDSPASPANVAAK